MQVNFLYYVNYVSLKAKATVDVMCCCNNKLPGGFIRELKRQVYTFNLIFNEG